MKKFTKKALAVLMVALLVSVVNAPAAASAASSVTIHVQDGQAWGSMNVYNWGDAGETAGVWPGTAMTAEADGWYTYTIDTDVPLNLVFSAEGGTPQSSNVNDVAADAGEIWVVIGGAGEANDMGAATNEAVLYLEPQDGWPVAAAVEEAATDSTATDAAATDTAATEVPKTGESTTLAVTFIAMAALSGVAAVVLKKKAQTNEN